MISMEVSHYRLPKYKQYPSGLSHRLLVLLVISSIISVQLIYPNISKAFTKKYNSENVLNFSSKIVANQNSFLTIKEEVTVIIESYQNKRGIYRDFIFNLPFNQEKSTFKILQVLRNNQPTHYWLENNNNQKRINIYHKNIYLSPGVYTYTITYKINQHKYFPDSQPRGYWNITEQHFKTITN